MASGDEALSFVGVEVDFCCCSNAHAAAAAAVRCLYAVRALVTTSVASPHCCAAPSHAPASLASASGASAAIGPAARASAVSSVCATTAAVALAAAVLPGCFINRASL
mgnify:CR=1 FL=1